MSEENQVCQEPVEKVNDDGIEVKIDTSAVRKEVSEAVKAAKELSKTSLQKNT